MDAELSPNYTHEKLENPSTMDLVDVFEDLWLNYVFSKVDLLLRTPNGDVAAMTVLCPYFESIGGYIAGEETNHRSKEFFTNGFCCVFTSDSPEIKKAAHEVYKYVRCGLAHEGMLGHKVHYSRDAAKPFFLTYRRLQDGTLDFDAGVVSIVVNPVRIFDAVLRHFNSYIISLRSEDDVELIESFRKVVERRWAIGSSENVIGMTEAEFLGRP